MANKQKLADQIRANVEISKAGEKKRKGGKTGLPKSASSNAYVAPHRHCTICQCPISLKRDPPVCGEKKCEEEYESRERQRKRWNILLYVAPAIMVGALALQLMASA
jgi:predicted nucleic acid-binding Zn ribbon protein